MKTLPKIGDQVRAINTKLNYKIKKSLGDGAQGKVYQIEYSGKKMALKWYKPNKATNKQKEIIEHLIETGQPCEKFLWPIDLVISKEINGFGYIMELREPEYKSIADLVARKVDTNYKVLAKLGYHLANSYRQLHSRGYCYRDINFDNIFFHPQTGDIRICDNDNVGINNQSEATVLGTQRFMAPEIVRGDKTPNTSSDIFSLAVLLFYIFMNNHPLHGKKESKIRCFDLPAMRKIYGEEPVFIFDLNDSSNRPQPGEHDNALLSWPIYPEFLQQLFTQTFTKGLNNANQRVREVQWRSAMLKLRDSIFYCQSCGRENFYDIKEVESKQELKCWGCKSQLTLPYRIKLGAKNQSIVMLNHDTKLYPYHINMSKKLESSPVAKVTQHPKNPSIWGLKNLSQNTWDVVNTKGENKKVAREKSVVLARGVKIRFSDCEGIIIY